jgi:2-oxoisovalerate dehydrogenase E2 component (dihydrolipoyl transacylase)
VRGTGPAGRIRHEDLDAFLREGQLVRPVGGRGADTTVEEVKVTGLRRRIAQNMAEAKRRVAHFSYVEEVDVTALEELRGALNAAPAPGRPRLTLLPFLMQAIVRAVEDFPQMNALYDDERDIVFRHGGVHIGVATQTQAGLMVPVVRHAEARDLWDCAAEAQRLAEAARAGRAAREELGGSTITITSLGALGGIVTTPVINRPEVAIVGVNRQAVRPVWQGGQFVPRRMMNLSSSFDHRVVDGYDAARFIQRIRALLEAPATIFIEA